MKAQNWLGTLGYFDSVYTFKNVISEKNMKTSKYNLNFTFQKKPLKQIC